MREREASQSQQFVLGFIALVIGVSVVTFGTGINMFVMTEHGRQVDRSTCTCDCFDGFMKGNYFVLGPGREYKHLYFNFTPAMLFLFAWSMFHWNMLMAFANRVLKAGLSGNLRVLVLIFAMLSFMQVYYGWGTVFNYVNDSIYHLWYTQWFFTLTEWIPAYCYYIMIDARDRPPRWLAKWAMLMACTHLYLALEDQGFMHLFVEAFQRHITTRDFFLLLADLVSVYTFGRELLDTSGESTGLSTAPRAINLKEYLKSRQFGSMVLTFIGIIIAYNILRSFFPV